MHTSVVEYMGKLRTQATHVNSNTIIGSDAPLDNKGNGELFSPTDLLATSLCQCMLTIMGIKADELNVNITGTKASVRKVMKSVPRRVQKIEIKIEFPGEAKSHHQIWEQAARDCPVALSLHPDIQQIVLIDYVN
ncbi:MAG: OsmC family protein [Bacteroidia bacterium]|jgi:putative redox protein|nr:OsmC family protein [Bacteroidia bacterium]